MASFKDKLLRKFFRDQEPILSRNKNFETFEDSVVADARRISRHLASVEMQLLELDPYELNEFTITTENGRRCIFWSIDGKNRKVNRRSYMTEKEWDLLIENREVEEKIEIFLNVVK